MQPLNSSGDQNKGPVRLPLSIPRNDKERSETKIKAEEMESTKRAYGQSNQTRLHYED
jgi:hypothetical protein